MTRENSGMESAPAYAEDKTMIYLNFVAIGQCPSVGQGVGVDPSQPLNQGRLAVIDVTRSADDERRSAHEL